MNFNKINDLLAEVIYNGRKVGYMEKEKGGYWLELNYKKFWIPARTYSKRKMYNFIKWHVESFEYRIQSEQNALSRGFKILA